jgi:hypothetical protein
VEKIALSKARVSRPAGVGDEGGFQRMNQGSPRITVDVGERGSSQQWRWVVIDGAPRTTDRQRRRWSWDGRGGEGEVEYVRSGRIAGGVSGMGSAADGRWKLRPGADDGMPRGEGKVWRRRF